MIDKITFSGTDPLTIRATGSGEFMKKELPRLVDLFDFKEEEERELIRQDNE